jgi:hypothetical protein
MTDLLALAREADLDDARHRGPREPHAVALLMVLDELRSQRSGGVLERHADESGVYWIRPPRQDADGQWRFGSVGFDDRTVQACIRRRIVLAGDEAGRKRITLNPDAEAAIRQLEADLVRDRRLAGGGLQVVT